MRLLLVELSRFRSRRAIVLLVLAGALLTALLAGSRIYETRPVTAQARAAAQAQADREAQRPAVQRDLRRCQAHPQRFFGPGATVADCAHVLPRPEWYLHREALSLDRERQDTGLGVLMIVAGLMVIVGTTFAGADWASGSMSNQLLFEPRRAKVWLAKAGAVFVGALACSAVIVTGFWVAMLLVAQLRGIDTGAVVQEQIRAMAARGVLLAALGALGGYALTMLLRHTVGTLAVLFAYAVAGSALVAALPLEGAGRWSVANNVFAWIQHGYTYFDTSVCSPRGDCGQEVLMTFGQGATYLGGLLLVAVLVSLVLFRRRDVA